MTDDYKTVQKKKSEITTGFLKLVPHGRRFFAGKKYFKISAVIIITSFHCQNSWKKTYVCFIFISFIILQRYRPHTLPYTYSFPFYHSTYKESYILVDWTNNDGYKSCISKINPLLTNLPCYI